MKTATAHIKQTPTDGSGWFRAIASTFDTEPDVQGDVVAPGAYLATIADWERRARQGRRMALRWQHRIDDPDDAIGVITSMRETPEGLEIEGQFDLASGLGMRVYEAVLSGRISELSIGYDVVKAHVRSDGVRVLDQVDLFEISFVAAGANRETRVLAVKAAPSGVPLDDVVAELRARVDRLSGKRRGAAPTAIEVETATGFKQRMTATLDEAARIVGLPTSAEIEAKAAERERIANLAGVNTMPPGSKRPRLLHVDARMRPVFEESDPERREREAREDRQAREAAELPVSVPVWIASEPTQPARDVEHVVVFDPSRGGVVRVPKASTVTAPVHGEGPKDGEHMGSAPLFAIGRGASA